MTSRSMIRLVFAAAGPAARGIGVEEVHVRAEQFLTAGIVTLVLAGGLFGFVFIGLVGLALFPVGLLLMILGVATCRGTSISTGQAWRGTLVAWTGLALLSFALWRSAEVAYSTAVHRNSPDPIIPVASSVDWLAAGGLSLIAAALFAVGLQLRAGWVRGRVIRWFLAAFAVCPASVALFFLLARWLPYTA